MIAPDLRTGPMLYTALIVLRPGHDENRPGTSTPSTPLTDRSPGPAVGIAHGSAIMEQKRHPPLSNSAGVAQAARTKKAAGVLPHPEDPTVLPCTAHCRPERECPLPRSGRCRLSHSRPSSSEAISSATLGERPCLRAIAPLSARRLVLVASSSENWLLGSPVGGRAASMAWRCRPPLCEVLTTRGTARGAAASNSSRRKRPPPVRANASGARRVGSGFRARCRFAGGPQPGRLPCRKQVRARRGSVAASHARWSMRVLS